MKDETVSLERIVLKFHSHTHLASRARANTPAASGAAADVPLCVVVHLPYRSVVAWKKKEKDLGRKVARRIFSPADL